MKKIKTLEISGKRWFQRTYGNTYHTTTVIVNGENGFDVPASNDRAYHYMQSFAHSAEDVKRKKDL